VSDVNYKPLYEESVLRRSDRRPWSQALAQVIADTVGITPGYELQLNRLDLIVDRLCEEIRARPLPRYAINLGPPGRWKVDPTIFGSYLVSHRAERLFQSVELAAGGLQNLERRWLQMAAIAARALFESAIVSCRAHLTLLTVWRQAHGDSTAVRTLCSDSDGELWLALYKARTATRAPYQETGGWLSATSVLTSLNVVTKGDEAAGVAIRDLYDSLCDATHPNLEANGTYWRVANPDVRGRPLVELAPGRSHSPLQTDVLSAVSWSLWNIVPFCRDLWWAASELAMVERFPAHESNELGLPRPTGRNDPCGSGLKTKACDHPEPAPLAEELADLYGFSRDGI
jgi:hypothetical protein